MNFLGDSAAQSVPSQTNSGGGEVSKRILRQYGVDFKNLPDEALVRLAWLIAVGILPFSAATLWRHIAAKKFPPGIKISAGCTAWRVGDVRAWLADPSGYHASSEQSQIVSPTLKTMRRAGK